MPKRHATLRTAIKSYGTAHDHGANDREKQVQIFSKVYSELTRAAKNPENLELCYEMILLNHKLWDAVRLSVLDPGFELGETLRKDLATLSSFVQRKTVIALGSDRIDPEILQELAGINRRMMLGLQGIAPTEEEMKELAEAEARDPQG